MKRDDEAYIHFQECRTSLGRAWRTIKELEGDDKAHPVVWRAAYQMALVDYAKPYKESRGANKRSHRLRFPQTFSNADRALHKTLLDLRDQFLAHSDLTIKDAKLHLVEVAGQPYPLISSNTDPQLPKLETVRKLIERTLLALDERHPEYLRQFKDAETDAVTNSGRA